MGDDATKKRFPLRPHIFRVPDDPAQEPYLIGSRCRECGEHFFPVRRVCLACGTETLEEAPLSGKGKVYTYTVARQQLPGAYVQVPYAIAVVTLAEGCSIHTVVTEDWEKVAIDQDVEVYFERVAADDEGNDLLAYKFRAVGP